MTFHSLLLLLLLTTMVLLAHSFRGAMPTVSRTHTSTIARSAWSILPTDSLKSTWYNEYNPTARAMVYNDPSPVESFSFVASGNDWPAAGGNDLSSSDMAEQASGRPRFFNPIRRVLRRRALLRQIRRHNDNNNNIDQP